MVSSQLQELARLASMQEVAERHDWDAVRSALGTDVPGDYKELIDNFGAGLFNYYVQIWGPNQRRRAFDLNRKGLYWNDYLHNDWDQRPDAIPAHLRGREVKIISWGSTEDALQLFWIAEPGKAPEQWEVAFLSETDSWEFFQSSAVEVLLSFVKGELPSSLLEPFDPGTRITYMPYS
jgi:hypothetical protein